LIQRYSGGARESGQNLYGREEIRMALNSELVGHVLTTGGKKAEMWLDTGWDAEKMSLILRVRFVDPETNQNIPLETIGDKIEEMEIGKAASNGDLSRQIQELVKNLKK
jgi:hypothetical protein